VRRLLVGVAVAVGVACAGAKSPATQAQALTASSGAPAGGEGASVSGLTFATYPDAGTYALASDQGHVVVLGAWATWCGPCLRSLPQLQALAQEYAGRGVRVYAVSVDEDRSKIGPFLAKAGVSLPVLVDPGGFLLEDMLKLRVMPTTWLIDRSGRVRDTEESYEGNLNALRAALDRLLAEAP
jgi:thiol-disulfide isomerase/thioredoxin